MDEYLAEIRLFAGTYPPRNWEYCEGQIIQASANQSLFSLLGDTYGGDGRSTFALPDFRGRTIIGTGSPQYRLGQRGGTEVVNLDVSNLPAHNHLVKAASTADKNNPVNCIFAKANAQINAGQGPVDVVSDSYSTDVQVLKEMNQAVVSTSGKGQKHENMQPFIGLRYIICVNGIYPQRND